MAAVNPYQSPKTAEAVPSVRPQPTYRSRGRAFLGGAWRGVKFGGGWMAAIVAVMALLVWGALLAMLLYRWLVQGVELRRLIETAEPLKLFLAMLGGIAMCSLYAAVLGALIMGIGAAITFRRPPPEARGKPSPAYPPAEENP